MIIRPRPGFLSLFFVMRGSIVPRTLPQIIGMTIYAVAVVIAVQMSGLSFEKFNITPFGLVGISLSIYLGFRNNAAYDRWWEARKLWGQLVYDIRNLARVSNTLIADKARRRSFLIDALLFCHFLRAHLRRTDAMDKARELAGDRAEELVDYRNRTDAVLRRMGEQAGALLQEGAIDPIGYRILDERLSSLAAVEAGCERISGTPLPFAYSLLLRRTAYIVCLLLPFALVSATGWATPLFTALITYTYFGLDALSEELEDPFGTEANDLPLDGLCRVCEISVFEALGEKAPPPLEGDRYLYT